MQNLAISIFSKFHDPPKNISLKQHRFFVVINYVFLMAGLFHFMFIFIFALFGLNVLSIYNIFSSLLWATCIYLNIQGWRVVQILIANVEVLIHAAFCMAILGWESGFHYYILTVPLIIFLSPWRIYYKIMLCVFNCIAYALLYYYANIYPPKILIIPVYMNGFNYFNIVAIFFSISFCAYYYRRIVLHVEQKLEIAHKETTYALNRINENISDAAIYVKTILPEPIHEGQICSNWGFIPSESLGGDAFGYNWLDQENFAIYLLDVSGHGVSAALLSATIMNVVRSNTLPGIDFREPDQVLTALNRSFPSENNNDMFFTIWYGVFNIKTRNLTFSSGGHPPALLFSDSSDQNTRFVRLGTRNHVIGGFENIVFRKDIKYLNDTSYLYVFSDGVYEFIQPDGNRWKYTEFESYLCGFHSGNDKDLDRLMSSIKGLNQSAVFEDDFTILKVSFY